MACIPVRTKGSTKCLQHKQKDVIFYCATCKTLVCPTCGISDRYCKQHDLHDISDVATEKTEEIRTFMNNVESRELPKLKLEIRSIGQKLKENSTLFHDLCKKMRVQASRCKEEIDILTSEFVSLCGRMENTNATLLRDYQKELQNIHDSLVQKTDECKHTLQKGTKIEIFDAAGDLPDLEKPIIPEVQEMETVEFKPQEVVSDLLKQALGLRETMYNLIEEPFILTRFTFGDQVTALFPSEREQAWVLSRSNAVLVDNNGNMVRELSVDMGSMSIAPKTGHIWFTCLEENINTVHELSLASSEPPITKFKLEDKPRRLCITRRNRVLVGTNRKILLCTTSGRVLRTSTNTERVTVVKPWKIVECPVTGNIAVGNEETESDDESDSKSHVVVFDQDLNLRFVYRGEDIVGSEETTFAPGSLVYDYMGNLVIADYNRDTIELVSGTGSYIRRIHTAEGYWQGNLGMQPGDILWALQISDEDNDEILRIKYYSN